MRTRLEGARATLVGFVVAVGVILVLVAVVGVADVVAAMAAADAAILVVMGLLALGWVAVWGGSLYVTLRVMDVDATVGGAVALYAHLMFLDNVVPFSSVAADPFAALAIVGATDADYETGLAAAVTVDFLNFLPAVAFGLAGLASLVVVGSAGASIGTYSLTLMALLVLLAGTGYLGWIYRRRIAAVGSRVVPAVLRAVESVVPRFSAPAESAVRDRLDTLVSNVERLAADRRALLVVGGFSTAGWTLLAATLWLSLYAVGVAVPVGLAMLLVALVPLGELVPLPGGVGSSESAFVALLVGLVGVAPAVATAGILLHRGATYWLPLVLGGGVIPLLLGDRL